MYLRHDYLASLSRQRYIIYFCIQDTPMFIDFLLPATKKYPKILDKASLIVIICKSFFLTFRKYKKNHSTLVFLHLISGKRNVWFLKFSFCCYLKLFGYFFKIVLLDPFTHISLFLLHRLNFWVAINFFSCMVENS